MDIFFPVLSGFSSMNLGKSLVATTLKKSLGKGLGGGLLIFDLRCFCVLLSESG